MAGIIQTIREFAVQNPFLGGGNGLNATARFYTGATTAMVPIHIPGIGAAVPRTTSTGGDVEYILAAQFTVKLAAVTVAVGDRLYYDSANAVFTNVKPTTGFYFGRCVQGTTTSAGYVDVLLLSGVSADYKTGGVVADSFIFADGTTSLVTGSGQLETIVVPGLLTTDSVLVQLKTLGSNPAVSVAASDVLVAGSITVFMNTDGGVGSGAVLKYEVKRKYT